MTIMIRALVATLAVVLSACGTTTVQSEQERIAIATDVYLQLPAAGELTQSFDAVQAIVGEYEDGSYSFAAHIEARPGSLSIVGMSGLGGPLFTINFDGTRIAATGERQAQAVTAEYDLADVLLVQRDDEWLNRNLQGASISTAEDGKERFVTRDDELLIGITYDSPNRWGGVANLTHMERQYSLRITTAEFTEQ
jgi:hypothetical protein